MGLNGERTDVQLSTLHGQSPVTTTVINDLVVTDMVDKNPVEIPRSYARLETPVSEQQIPTPKVVQRSKHLHSVAERKPKFIPNLGIGVLIGSNCPAAMEPLEVVPGGDTGPYAMRLRNGWTLTGPLHVKEVVLPQAILQMFELDFNDRKSSPNGYSYSQEDKKFISKIKENIYHRHGHYVIPLPFRERLVTMPNNRDQALKRANWQRKKMLRDES